MKKIFLYDKKGKEQMFVSQKGSLSIIHKSDL